MPRIVSALAGILLLVMTSYPASAQSFNATKYDEKKRIINDITVSIMVSGISCTCAVFAEDIRNVVNNLGSDGLRVLPILGIGGTQNVDDILFLRGIDMGVVDQDNLDFMKKNDPSLYGNIENRVHYITKLYNAEFHIIARDTFKTVADLRGKRVSFNLKNSHTHTAADAVFDLLAIETDRSYHDNSEAYSLLKDGKIDAHIVSTGAPQSGMAKLKKADGVNLIPLTEADLPPEKQKLLYSRYLPADLTHELYPDLIDEGQTVPTIANRAVLAVYNWEEGSYRYNKLSNFIQHFFGKIDKFTEKSRHPKWSEVNLAADVPGWTRFKPAQQWLDGRRVASNSASKNSEQGRVLSAFEAFLTDYTDKTGTGELSAEQRNKLFSQFQQFLTQKNRETAAQ